MNFPFPSLRIAIRLAKPLLYSLTLGLLQGQSWAQDSNAGDCEATPAVKSCGLGREQMDWVPWLLLPESQRDQRALHCNGGYLDPLAAQNTSIDPSTQPIYASSPASEMEGDIVRMTGGAIATQGYRQLRADTAEFDQVTRRGSLHGNVELREPGLLLRGATGDVDIDSGRAQLTASTFLLHDEHLRGGADLLVRREDKVIVLNDASYSYCPPNSERWMLYGDEVELHLDEGEGIARNATIEFGGVPILYTPYLSFPLDDRRKSGFLWADVGTDSSGGLDIATPYYFNLAPNYDATLTPRWINERGLLTELELRYLSEQMGYWELGGAYIHGDNEYEKDFPDQNGNRWLAAVQQHGLFAKRFRTTIDFTKTEDDDYLSDFDTTTLKLKETTHLAQRGEVNYLGDNWSADLRIEEYQTIARDVLLEPYEKLPQLTVYRSALEQPFRPNLVFLSDFTEFDHETRVTGQRLYNEGGATLPMTWVWGFLRPTAKYRQINYELDEPTFFDEEEDDSPDVGAPLFSLDGGLVFERTISPGQSTFLQTLEPRLYYLWADYEDQTGLPDFDTSELSFNYDQLFRDTRFSGHDRLDDANQLSVGLTTRIIDPDTGVERVKASIGQIYYFDDRRIDDELIGGELDDRNFQDKSEIAAQLDLRPWDSYEFRSSWVWNRDQDELEQTSISTAWQDDESRRIVNLGYNFRRYRGINPFLDDINQVDLSSYFPLNQHWSLLLRVLYDFKEDDRIDDMVGFEYNDCCWRIRIVHHRSLDQTNRSNDQELVERDHATYVQFQLKGLGGTADNVSGLLEELIRGFTDSDK